MNSARGWLLLALMLLSLQAAAQAVGRVLVAVGDVAALRAGQAFPLATGAEILDGDLVRTGEASSAQLRFTDGGVVAMRAKSRFHVAGYRFTGQDDGVSEAAFRLLQGGIRTLTGIIGSARRDRYRMATPIATLGIRGTAYSLVHCEADCEADDGSLAPDGTYGLVLQGRVAVANAGGEMEFARDEAFFVADALTPPQPLVARPRLLRDRLEARARREGREAARETIPVVVREAVARVEAALDARFGADARVVTVVGTPASPIVVAELRDGSGNLALLGPGLGAGAAFSAPVASVGLVDGGRGTVIQLDAQRGFLDRFAFNGGVEQGDRRNAAVLDSGRIEGDGGAVWGRWAPGAGVSVRDVAGVPGTGVHFFFGNLSPESLFGAAPAGLTSVRYDLAGGPRPTDENGHAGQLLGGSFVVDFVQRSLGGQLGYRVDNVSYVLPVPAGTPIAVGRGFAGFTVLGQGTGAWSCASCPDASGRLAHYNLSGLFLGSRAQGIGVAFGTQDPIVGRTAGTAIFRCVSGGCR